MRLIGEPLGVDACKGADSRRKGFDAKLRPMPSWQRILVVGRQRDVEAFAGLQLLFD